MNGEAEKLIIIPKGAEINEGNVEDIDSFILDKPFKALIVGEEADGAIPVQLIIDGKVEDQIRFWHQPPKVV